MKQYFVIASLLFSAAAYANDVAHDKSASQQSMTSSQAPKSAKTPGINGLNEDSQGRSITAPPTKTRAQVAAETAEAGQLGLLAWGGHGPKKGTAQQEDEVRMAGEQASGHSGTS